MLRFLVKYDFYGKEERWFGYIPMLHYSGDYLLFSVQLAESLLINVCKSYSGYLVCLMNCESSIDVPSLFDIGEIVDGMTRFLGEKSAVTVAFALKHVGTRLSYPRRRRKKTLPPIEDIPFLMENGLQEEC